MTLLRLLDETAVLVATGVWMELHATPLALVIALGVAALGALLVVSAQAEARRCALVPVPVTATGRPRRPRERRTALPLASAPVGARGPRAPGHRMPRPLRSH